MDEWVYVKIAWKESLGLFIYINGMQAARSVSPIEFGYSPRSEDSIVIGQFFFVISFHAKFMLFLAPPGAL